MELPDLITQKKETPVEFSYEGKAYRGVLSHVPGTGTLLTFHLYVNKRYWGSLGYSSYLDDWVFHPTPKDDGKGLEKLSRDFGYVIECWLQ